MHFVLQTPSLQHLVQVKIVATLMNQPDILTHIKFYKLQLPSHYFYLPEEKENWTVMEERVKSKVRALPLPEPSKKKLSHFVKPLRREISAWCRSYNGERDNNKFLYISFRNKLLRWTMHGTVDYAKTAELMVRDERVELEQRYQIACLNCLEDEARQLIQFIPEETILRKKYLHGNVLINYFTCILTGQELEQHLAFFYQTLGPQFRDELINKYLFYLTLSRNSRATSEYFFEKLSPEGKEQVLVEYQKEMFRLKQKATCNFLYYLYLRNKEQQRRVFENYTDDVLQRLLRWPTQPLFVEAAECGWGYMNENQCSTVLLAIIDKISDGFEDYDYVQLFRECWRLSRDECKRHFLFDGEYLIRLINTKEDELIKLVFNEAPWDVLKELVENRYDEISGVLMDESVISDVILMECKQTAALNSENEPEDEEKRLRSEQVSRLLEFVIENRMKSREQQFDEQSRRD